MQLKAMDKHVVNHLYAAQEYILTGKLDFVFIISAAVAPEVAGKSKHLVRKTL